MTSPTSKDDSQEGGIPEGGGRVKVVSDPERIKILVDPMRRRILRTMKEGIENEEGIIRKEMTVPEIARKLGVSAPKCYHHLDLLVEHGFVKGPEIFTSD